MVQKTLFNQFINVKTKRPVTSSRTKDREMERRVKIRGWHHPSKKIDSFQCKRRDDRATTLTRVLQTCQWEAEKARGKYNRLEVADSGAVKLQFVLKRPRSSSTLSILLRWKTILRIVSIKGEPWISKVCPLFS